MKKMKKMKKKSEKMKRRLPEKHEYCGEFIALSFTAVNVAGDWLAYFFAAFVRAATRYFESIWTKQMRRYEIAR